MLNHRSWLRHPFRTVSVLVALGIYAGSPAMGGEPVPSDIHICIDQFGYPAGASKIAVIRSPVVGFDAPNPYTPGATLELRRTSDDAVVLTGPATAWTDGAMHVDSGDQAWWFDFTSVTTQGSYYVFDPTTAAASEPFEIGDDVYVEVARHALRMYFYQRCGVAKDAAFAEAAWADTACHTDDLAARSVTDQTPGTARDLSGGWHDAGDYNKYMNFTDDAVHSLLEAYTANPGLWNDTAGLPESGNDVPDLLDEIRVELDWMMRMQNADGSVLHKLSSLAFGGTSPPSTDPDQRFYASPTASATISLCGVFAHAAIVYGDQPDGASHALAVDLEAAALSAWNWLEANPAALDVDYTNDGGLFSTALAEDFAYDRLANRVRAAVHLFRMTGDTSYRDFVDTFYVDIHLMQWFYAIPYERPYHEALLAYAVDPGATPSVAMAITDMYAFAMAREEHLGNYENAADPYRAFLFDTDTIWGSNRIRCNQGSGFALAVEAGLAGDDAQTYRDAAAGFIHSIHGVNPLGLVYLTNMSTAGAERSANETYHGWFADGTIWDSAATSLHGPPPGYLNGGPNWYFETGDGSVIAPPMNQPPMKSYLDWNAGWPESSWQVSECHIPYQAAYLRLLASVAPTVTPSNPADLNNDGIVDVLDLLQMLSAWGPCPGCDEDVDGDGDVGINDLLTVLANWG